jgi:sugar-specific transcriptional regulator TrmB
MSFNRLKAIGFKGPDASVYELLIREGESERNELAKKTGLTKADLEESLTRLITYGAVEIRNNTVIPTQPKSFLQKYLRTKEVDLEIQLSDLRTTVNEIQSTLDPIYSESRYGLRLEELWQVIDGMPSMEMETVRMISRARTEIRILAEKFRWYNKVREELLSALDRRVKVKVLLLADDADTKERVEDMKKYGVEVRLAKCDWRSLRFTLADSNELTFLIWARKNDDSRVYYRPGFTKNQGLINVFCDSFEYLWEKAKPI